MFEKRKAQEEKFQMKLMNCKNVKERDTCCASETSFDAHKLYSTSELELRAHDLLIMNQFLDPTNQKLVKLPFFANCFFQSMMTLK